MSPEYCSAEPVESDVLVLDDEKRVSASLVTELRLNGIAARCEAVSNVADLRREIEQASFEAVSIDGEVGGFYVGREVLDLVHDVRPSAATIIYTKHDWVLNQAAHSSADECLRKEASPDAYLIAMRRITRLGHARHIAGLLVGLGAADVPALPHGRRLDEDTERFLCALGRAEAARRLFAGTDGLDLVSLLARRGWWKDRTLDIVEYAALPTLEKLRALLNTVGITRDDLAVILRSSEEETEALLDRSATPGVARLDPGSGAHRLLAVLSSLSALANYRPDLMGELWASKNIYSETAAAPPWDSLSLRQYLIDGGPRAISDSLYWLRCH